MTAHLDIPFGFNVRGRTATSDPDDHIRDLIKLVLFTAPGERVNRPDFGCGLKQLVFAPLSDALEAMTQQLVQGALLRWLGDLIHVDRVEVRVEDAQLSILVSYAVLETGALQVANFERPLGP